MSISKYMSNLNVNLDTSFTFAKPIIPILACCVPAFSVDTKQVEDLLKSRTNMDFKVISSDSNVTKDSSFVVVEAPSGERLSAIVSNDGKFLVPLSDGVGSGDSKSRLELAISNVQKYNKDKKDEAVLALFKKYDKHVLKIQANANVENKTKTYMIIDSTCPYCLQEIQQLDSYLNKGDLELLVVGILGQRAFNRSAIYYGEFPKAKTREQKISLIKKAFKQDYDGKSKNESIAREIADSTLSAGVHGVPFIMVK